MPKLVSELSVHHPCGCDVLKSVRTDYAHWNWTYHKGYIRYNLNGTTVYEHQLVVSYGYKTGISNKDFHAHHRDKNKHNNAFSNLDILKAADHSRLHITQDFWKSHQANLCTCSECNKQFSRPVSMIDGKKANFCSRKCYMAHIRKNGQLGGHEKKTKLNCKCLYCKKEFQGRVSPSRTNHYCSNECKHLASRKRSRPSKQELESILSKFNFSTSNAASHLGVPGGTFRDWMKSYGIPCISKRAAHR